MVDRNDDHYIPDIHNAHIDTGDFEAELANLAGDLTGQALDDADLWPQVHSSILDRLAGAVEQPAEDALICRYLSPMKFLWFLPRYGLYFGSARAFDDRADCAIPADYNNSVQHFFLQRDVTPIAWDDYADRYRAQWLVSSWTELTDHHDDHLLWHRYAGGPSGVGVTIRYCDLLELLTREGHGQNFGELVAGRISYGSPLRIPPFSKRRIFRNEKEIRFVFRGEALASVSISILALRDRIRLRFSPDASPLHIDAVMETWTKWGGSDQHQIGGV